MNALMRPNPVRAGLQAGGSAYGTMAFEFFTPGLMAVLAEARAEFVLLDTEHSGVGIETIKMQIAASRGLGIVPMVRVPGHSASRAPCHTVLLGAAPAVFQPRGGPSNPKSWHHKKSGAEHSIQRHSSSPTGLSGGCAKPIFDHAHERSAKRQGERGLILCPLSSNLPYRSRRVELRLQQRRKTGEAGFELSVPRDTTKVLKTPEVASA